MADRFYCPEPPVAGEATLNGDEAHHLARVRRVKPGERVELFDGRGRGYRAEVRTLGKDHVRLAILEPLPDERAAPVVLTLATAVPKGERFNWLVEKATELGVARLVALKAERSAVDPRAAKLDRLRRAVIEASKQCGRFRLMDLDPSVGLGDYLERESAPIRLLAHPGGSPADRWPRIEPRARVALAVGPEGGFTDSEAAAARSAGWEAVDLGPTRLRIETAGLAGVAAILARVRSEPEATETGA